MAKKDRMKNGLASLFDDNYQEETADEASSAEQGLQNVRISMIEPDREQPRKQFNEEKLSELADNISQMGLLQPIIVRPAEVQGRYTIVAGERRWRAARIAGLSEIPVIVRELTPAEAAQYALIENLQREDLNPIEEAKAFKRLKESFSMTQESIAKAVGKSRSAVANSMRLLDLEPECLEALEEGKLTAGHAKALLMKQDRAAQLSLLELTLNEGLNVRQLENLASKDQPAETAVKAPKKMSAGDRDFEEYRLSMKDAFGVNASFKKAAGGKLTMKVSFDREGELKEFLKRLTDK